MSYSCEHVIKELGRYMQTWMKRYGAVYIRFALLVVILAVSVNVLGCGKGCGRKNIPTPDEPGDQGQGEIIEPAYGDALIEGSIGDATYLNPIIVSDNASFAVIGLVFNGLVKYDKDLNLVGDLAESWDISADGLVYTFHLRKGVKWHDGEEFTAADVEFTYLSTIDPQVKNVYKSDYELVDRVEVVDDYTFRVYYKKVFAPSLESWGMDIVPKHVLENVDINTSKFNRSPIGTGSFRFKEWITDERIVLEAFDQYYEGRPFLDRYVFRVIPDKSIMFLELKKGGVDYMNMKPDQFQKMGSSPDFEARFNKHRYPSFGYTYLGYNLNFKLFQDQRVREAITFGLDRDEMINGVIRGFGQKLSGPFHPDSWAYDKSIEPRRYSTVKAKQILEDAGWEDTDGDGWIDKDINGDGARDPFEFTLITNHGNKSRELTAQIVKSNLKKLGIRVDVELIEWTSFLNKYVDVKNYQALILGWDLPVDPDVYNMWHSSCIDSGNNITSYSNSRVDELLKKARETLDKETRKAYYYEIHEIINKEIPYTFLFAPDSLVALSNRFHGVSVTKSGIKHNIIRWYVPGKEQKYAH